MFQFETWTASREKMSFKRLCLKAKACTVVSALTESLHCDLRPEGSSGCAATFGPAPSSRTILEIVYGACLLEEHPFDH